MLSFKHGFRRKRSADGLPSIRQQELARRVTHDERVKAEADRVKAGKEEAARKGREKREEIRMRKVAR
jgi:hypothetical protein